MRQLRATLQRILNEEPEENLLYLLLLYLQNIDPATAYALMQRAQTGEPFPRPFGHVRRPRLWDQLVFVPAQLARTPLHGQSTINTQVTVGPRGRRPR